MEYNFYQILGVSQNAPFEDIKAAYKKLAKQYHPDKHQQNEFYEEHFKKITEAYHTLSNHSRRSKYDLKLSYQKLPPNPPSPSATKPIKQDTSRSASGKPIRKKKKFLNKKEFKMLAICLSGLFILVTLSVLLNNFMNRYSAEQLYNEGSVLEENKVYLAALEKYSEAIEFDKEYPEPYTKRGLLRIKFLGDYDGGLYDLSMAIQHSKKAGHLVYFNRAKIYIKLKNYTSALQDLQRTANENPKFDSTYFYQAEIYNYILNDYQKAIGNYSKFIDKNNSSPDSYFGRGYAYQNNKKYSLSLQDYNSAILLAPEKGNYYYYRGFVKINCSDTLGACVDWDQSKSQGFDEATGPMQKYCNNIIN